MESAGPVIRTPDQRVRVFVSSTLQELAEERAAARRAIQSLRLAPVLFELGARPHPPRALYRAYLAQSHIFVGIYWQRYGWVAPGEAVSGLEDEYNLSGGRPRLIYVKSPAPDREARLNALLDRIRDDDTASYKTFASAAELEALLADDLAVLLTERFEMAQPVLAASPAAAGEPPPAHDDPPAPPTRLIGRDDEIAAVRALLLDPAVRLVTLTGPGGIGKSRLAAAVAAGVKAQFEDGIFFVSLAAVSDPDLVPAGIAQAMGVRAGPGQSPLEAVKADIRGKRLLLLLDNFEQVVAGAPALTTLLQAAPGLKILVTSREVLRLRGEHEFALGPLAVPRTDTREPAARLSRYDSVRLFIERAQAVSRDFSVTDENAPAVAEICHRLDGIPLAIELAAARLRALTPQAMLARMGHRRLRLLTGGARDLPARHQTLRHTIDWSYSLLEDHEKHLFSRLSVFAGGCTLEAATVVCDPDGKLDVLAGIESLIEKSLLRRTETERGEPRFVMLETIREYATERLQESDEAGEVRRRHAGYYLALLDAAENELQGSQQHAWLRRLDTENENLRALMRRALRGGDPGTVARVGWVLWLFWYTLGRIDEGRRWLEAALASPAPMSEQDHARALTVAGVIAFWQGEYTGTLLRLREAERLFRTVDDRRGLALALLAQSFLAGVAHDDESPSVRLDASIKLMRETEYRFGLAIALISRGRLALIEGDYRLMEEHFREALAICEEVGDSLTVAMALGNMGWAAAIQGDASPAAEYCRRALEHYASIRSKDGTAFALEGLAMAAVVAGQPERAARLLGAADALRDAAGTPMWPVERVALDEAITRVRATLGDAVFEQAWREGRATEEADAVAYARDLAAAA